MTEEKDIIQGKVKWFNSKRGFGVVSFKINDEDEDAFIHHSNIMTKDDVYKELFENEVIEFKLNRQDDKYYALEIRGQNGGPLLCENINKVKLIADGTCSFTRSIGMNVKWIKERGLGERSWRYSTYIEDGIVINSFIESPFKDESVEDPFEVSDAETMLSYLKEKLRIKV